MAVARNLDGMDLAELIRQTKGDRSYQRLADASPASPSRQRWQQMGSRASSSELPEPSTLHAMAHALGVSERVVVLAAARTAGLDVGEDRGSLATLLPPSVDQLSETQVAAVLSVIRALLESRDGTPTKRAAPAAREPINRDERIADGQIDRLFGEGS